MPYVIVFMCLAIVPVLFWGATKYKKRYYIGREIPYVSDQIGSEIPYVSDQGNLYSKIWCFHLIGINFDVDNLSTQATLSRLNAGMRVQISKGSVSYGSQQTQTEFVVRTMTGKYLGFYAHNGSLSAYLSDTYLDSGQLCAWVYKTYKFPDGGFGAQIAVINYGDKKYDPTVDVLPTELQFIQSGEGSDSVQIPESLSRYDIYCEKIDKASADYRNLKTDASFSLLEDLCLNAIGEIDEYIDAYIGVHRSRPDYFQPFVKLAIAYEQNKQYADAIDITVRAIKLNLAYDGYKNMHHRLNRLLAKAKIDKTAEDLLSEM